MVGNKVNKFLIPNVSSVGRKKNAQSSKSLNKSEKNEFKNLLNKNLVPDKVKVADHGVKISVHAAKRLAERNLKMDTAEFFKIKQAISTLKNKGGKDSLVVTEKAAYIVDVDSSKIVTAIDKGSMGQNVFTKIDSTLFVD